MLFVFIFAMLISLALGFSLFATAGAEHVNPHRSATAKK